MQNNTQNMENYFVWLYDVDVSDKTRKKNNLTYLSWAAAWAEVKKRFPDAMFHVYEWAPDSVSEIHESYDENGNLMWKEIIYPSVEPRPWFVANGTGYVKVGVTINGIEYVDPYPIMDHANRPIPAEKITTVDANKSKMRALAKGIAFHGLGLYIYMSEDLPENVKKERTTLAAARKKVVAAAQAAVKRGVVNTEIYKLIGEHNDGNQSPDAIPSVVLCEELIGIIKSMKPDATKSTK